MNIFVLDTDPQLAARYHCDKHVVKMILESAQLLSTAHHLSGSSLAPQLYNPTHHNHPCNVWVRSSRANYAWTFELLDTLLQEYTRRYLYIHSTASLMPLLDTIPALPDIGRTEHVLCMPDEYKIAGNPVESYRAYYRGDKQRIAKWAYTEVPNWFAAR